MWIFLNLIITLCLACGQCQGVSRLEDLRTSYLETYPKRQYISSNFTKGVHNINTQRFDSNSWRRCQETSEFSSVQFRELKKYYGQEFLLNATIENMLYKPRGRFFSGDNYDTFFEDYHIALAGPGDCYNLINPKPLSLVKTWRTCIRVFKYSYCFGWSLAMYPGSLIPRDELEEIKFTEIKSVGPCLPDEFLSSSLKPEKQVEAVKNPQFKDHNPDLIELTYNSETFYNFNTVNNGYGTSIGLYLLSPKNRIKFMYAAIGSNNTNNDAEANQTWRENVNFHADKMEVGDVLCYVIPPKFGGPTNVTFNVFIASKSTAKIWANICSNFPTPTTKSETLEIFYNFIYEDDIGSRPLFFYYYARANEFISYGRVLNGFHENFRTTPTIFHHLITKNNFQTVKENTRLRKLLHEISHAGNSTNFRNFNQETNQVWKCSGASASFFSDFQENYLTNDAERKEAQALALHRMVEKPVARFYSGVNYTGYFEDFSITYETPRGFCYDLTRLKGRINSIATFGTCIRIFQGPECAFMSLLIYPETEENSNLSEILTHINLEAFQSVGPCLLGEMHESYFSPSQKLVPKNIFPHLIAFFDRRKLEFLESVAHGSIVYYALGEQNRTEIILALVEPQKYLDLTNFREEDYPVCLKNEEDKNVCYAVPPILNGPTDQPYNTFEATKEAMEDWIEVISDFQVEYHRASSFAVNFVYEDENSTTPIWLYYYGYHQRRSYFYGQVYNGEHSNTTYYPRGNWRFTGSTDGYIYFSLVRTQH